MTTERMKIEQWDVLRAPLMAGYVQMSSSAGAFAGVYVSRCDAGCHTFAHIGILIAGTQFTAQLALDDAEALAAHIIREVERVREEDLRNAPPPPIPGCGNGEKKHG